MESFAPAGARKYMHSRTLQKKAEPLAEKTDAGLACRRLFTQGIILPPVRLGVQHVGRRAELLR
jgi:hypothetical protein